MADKSRKIVKVEAIDVFREGCFGYIPFPVSGNPGTNCPYCGKRTKKDPCIHCGYPIMLRYIKPMSEVNK